MRYFLSGLAALVAAWWLRGSLLILPWVILLWISASCFALTYSYLRHDATLFGKRGDGSFERSASVLLLLPYLLLKAALFHLKRRVERREPWNEVAPGIYVGRRVLPAELPVGIELVIDVTAEYSEPRGVVEGRRYLCLPTLDREAPDEGKLRALVDEVTPFRRDVYIHCGAGKGRSATVAAALLVARGQAGSGEEALCRLRAARACVHLHPPQKKLLERFALLTPVAGESESRPRSGARL